jgi:hypothetical protein
VVVEEVVTVEDEAVEEGTVVVAGTVGPPADDPSTVDWVVPPPAGTSPASSAGPPQAAARSARPAMKAVARIRIILVTSVHRTEVPGAPLRSVAGLATDRFLDKQTPAGYRSFS